MLCLQRLHGFSINSWLAYMRVPRFSSNAISNRGPASFVALRHRVLYRPKESILLSALHHEDHRRLLLRLMIRTDLAIR